MEHTSKSEYRKETYPEQGAAFRASISFPPDLDETLEEVPQQNKVSLAWVVRDAAERYVADGAEDGRVDAYRMIQRNGARIGSIDETYKEHS